MSYVYKLIKTGDVVLLGNMEYTVLICVHDWLMLRWCKQPIPVSAVRRQEKHENVKHDEIQLALVTFLYHMAMEGMGQSPIDYQQQMVEWCVWRMERVCKSPLERVWIAEGEKFRDRFSKPFTMLDVYTTYKKLFKACTLIV
jgi:hypothetical protein